MQKFTKLQQIIGNNANDWVSEWMNKWMSLWGSLFVLQHLCEAAHLLLSPRSFSAAPLLFSPLIDADIKSIISLFFSSFCLFAVLCSDGIVAGWGRNYENWREGIKIGTSVPPTCGKHTLSPQKCATAFLPAPKCFVFVAVDRGWLTAFDHARSFHVVMYSSATMWSAKAR